MSAELLIQNGTRIFSPAVEEGIEWSTERAGAPGKLTFNVLIDDQLDIQEGNAVRLKWNDQNVFYGFVFSIMNSSELKVSPEKCPVLPV